MWYRVPSPDGSTLVTQSITLSAVAEDKCGYSFLDTIDAVSIWSGKSTFVVDRDAFVALRLN
jgi:hypothetical protein